MFLALVPDKPKGESRLQPFFLIPHTLSLSGEVWNGEVRDLKREAMAY